jgi:hypothetical protein
MSDPIGGFGPTLGGSQPDYAWPMLLCDYPEALVRIASLRADTEQHLIFGWIELYPFDMVAPDSWLAGKKPWRVPGKSRWSCGYSATRVSAADAVRWYKDAACGVVNIAVASTKPVHASAVEFAPEPAFGRFAIGVDAPFTFRWHDGPRIHRLVPLRRPPRAVCQLGKSEPARRWLRDNLGFDPFSFDEWLGSVAMVAPDPLCASVGVFPSQRTPEGREILSLQIAPRRSTSHTADLSTITLHVGERRSGAWTSLESFAATGSTYRAITYPQSTGNVGHALVCRTRGLMRMVEPNPWLHQVHLNMAVGVGQAFIEVPSGGRRKPAQQYEVTRRMSEITSVVGEPVDDRARDRLNYLLARRKKREKLAGAPQYVFGVHSSPPPSQADIDASKAKAQKFVVDLVARARRRLIFVDPFFGQREMRLFALRNENNAVTPRILTGLLALKSMVGPTPGFQVQAGLALVADLKGLREHYGSRTPLIRVMPGGDVSDIHDRYLLIDDEVWHCGPSFNELGERLGVIVRSPNPLEIRRMVGRVWMRSQPISDLV